MLGPTVSLLPLGACAATAAAAVEAAAGVAADAELIGEWLDAEAVIGELEVEWGGDWRKPVGSLSRLLKNGDCSAM
jgi:hypothetical protein